MTVRERLLLIIPGVLFLVAFGSFELGRWGGVREAERKQASQDTQAASEADPMQGDAELIETLLGQNLGERTFQLSNVIAGATGTTVRRFDPTEPAAKTILDAVRAAANHALRVHNTAASPVRALRRINEASRFFEDTLREHLDAHPELFCTIPPLADGTEQRTGYPDLRIEHVASGTIAYLDPKLFEEDSRRSSLRTFYYTPRGETNKVLGDAHHLLLGFAHDGADGRWTFTSWELVDLALLEVQLKPEFSASNRDLYRKEFTLARSNR